MDECAFYSANQFDRFYHHVTFLFSFCVNSAVFMYGRLRGDWEVLCKSVTLSSRKTESWHAVLSVRTAQWEVQTQLIRPASLSFKAPQARTWHALSLKLTDLPLQCSSHFGKGQNSGTKLLLAEIVALNFYNLYIDRHKVLELHVIQCDYNLI